MVLFTWIRVPVSVVLAAVFVCAGPARAAGTKSATFPAYKVTVTSGESTAFVLNKHLTLNVTLSPLADDAPPATGLKFDARMPQHKHGMVTTAKVTKVKDLEYKVEGVRLHMPGQWVFDFIIEHKGGETRISAPFDLGTM